MRVLLDTNIIIDRESRPCIPEEIGKLFFWLNKIHCEQCVHPLTIKEIEKYGNPEIIRNVKIKLSSYFLLKTEAPLTQEITNLIKNMDRTKNDEIDSRLLNELLNKRVDILISNDDGIHEKAKLLKIINKVFTIDAFIEKITSEHPELIDYKILSIKKEFFGKINLNNPFFDSFRRDYCSKDKPFDDWFQSKCDETAYVCMRPDSDRLLGFLYIKTENESENYNDITPLFQPKRRLKIGSFKVELIGFNLGERFLKIIFDNALRQRVDEIYVTIFNTHPEKQKLINLLTDWGFKYWGLKKSSNGQEEVYVRDFSKSVNTSKPKHTFPFFSLDSNAYIVSIHPEYHTRLFPDSILTTESSNDFFKNDPCANALTKVYVSKAIECDLKSGDILIFYRTGGKTGNPRIPARYKGVITTIGIVESVNMDIQTKEEFINYCRTRTVFNNDELIEYWKGNKPFVVTFLYTYSFPHRINLQKLIELKIIKDATSFPRGFGKISKDDFKKILEETNTNPNILIN
jgi:predicted nucleic acid-binding protein